MGEIRDRTLETIRITKQETLYVITRGFNESSRVSICISPRIGSILHQLDQELMPHLMSNRFQHQQQLRCVGTEIDNDDIA